ncbi:hypothetical protein OXV74_21995 [Bacteroides thetaiotaomicron]|nr:hypothetical protein [Bacteroides thetaiotaomicron]
MKNKITKSLLVILLSILCFSCEKEEFYSCNPKADQWVKDNLNEIRTMTRKEWINIDDVIYQKAAFTAFTTKQRHDLWVRKFDEILTLDLTEQEQSHLLLMNDVVKIVHNGLMIIRLKNVEIRWTCLFINGLKWLKTACAGPIKIFIILLEHLKE